MKRLFLLLTLLTAFMGVKAQDYKLSGTVVDSKTGEPLVFSTAALLGKDNTVQRGTMTDSLGRYNLALSNPGAYTLRISYIGYKTTTQKVNLNDPTNALALDTIRLVSEENTLSTATVTATVARVQQIGDTTQFNAAAYRTPEGSTLEALVKQLPGVEVSDDGTIKWNGKTVSEFLINGKDFFKGDTKIAMKNIPTEMVSKIKAYDKKSDYAEQTGIDDGEETTVLDLTTKRELNESWITNADVAYGNHERYSGRVFISRFTDNSRITLIGNANNTGDRGFGGPRGFGGGSGLTANKSLGMDFTWDNGKKRREAGRFEIGGNARYSHSSSDLEQTSSTETFITPSSFSNSHNFSWSHSTNVNANLHLEWNPDSMTFINIRPEFSHSDSHSSSASQTATFNSDPYQYADDPLQAIFNDSVNIYNIDSIAVNRNQRYSRSNSNSNSFGANLNLIRRLGSKGRNISFRASYNFSKGKTTNYAFSDIKYYNGTQGSIKNQYTFTPNKNWNYSLRFGYVEPLGGKWFAELRYEYSYRYQDSRRSLYNLDQITGEDSTYYQTVESLGHRPSEAEVMQDLLDSLNSQYATYKYTNHRVNIGVRYNSDKVRFNAGVSFNPQHTKMNYNRPAQLDTLITRRVFNVSPEVRLRYNFSRTNRLELNYRGSASQPTMTNLLDVVDDSDPLNISMGNPGLKPSWSNSLRAMYNAYNADKLAGMMAGIDFSQTSNSISNRIVYDNETGVTYSRPENINGNWNLNGRFMYNFAFGYDQKWSLTTFTNLGYTRNVAYVSNTATQSYIRGLVNTYFGYNYVHAISDKRSDDYKDIFNNAESTKNRAKTFSLGENLNLNYRTTYFDIGATGSLNYQNGRNSIQTNANLDTWQYSYGLTANATTDWGMSISTDIRMSSRRGYSDKNMNTNELLWNAQIAQSFLSNKALTLSVQFYDILHKQSNVSRSLSATMRSDSWSNAINSYFMVHLIYKLNIFGGKANKGGSGNRDQDRNIDGPRGGGFGGPGGGGPGRF